MGVELRYMGLPPGCGFVELVRGRTWVDGYYIGAVHSFLEEGTKFHGERIMPTPGQKYPKPDRPEEELIWNWCCEALVRFPDLAQRYLTVYKAYRWLPFLLSAKERKASRWPKPAPLDPRSWNDPASSFDALSEQAFHGAPLLAPGVTGSQGLPIRLIDRNTTSDLGFCLAAIELDEIRPRIEELVEFDMIPSWDKDRTLQTFCEFQQFFAQAAERGEEVMVIWE